MTGPRASNRTLHWIIAAFILAALASGFVLTRSGTFSVALLQAHLAFGTAAGVLTLIRVLTWLTFGAPERIYPVSSRILSVAGSMVHALLRLVPLALLASGVGMIALTGAFPALAAGTLPGLAVFENLPPRHLHHAAAALLVAVTGLHGAAAFWHRWQTYCADTDGKRRPV